MVHPCLGGQQGTPLAWASSFFNMWTGSLKMTFYFSVPSTARGSLIIMYTPNILTVPTYGQVTQCQPIIVDVAGSTSVTIDIGWHAYEAALPLVPVAWPSLTTATGGAIPCNGVLSVFVQQPFVASGATAYGTSVVVTLEPGDDFAFLDPNCDYPNNLILVSAQVRTPLFQVATRHFDHRIEGIRRTPEQVAALSGGEIIKSLRQLIKRRTPHFIRSFASGNTGGQALDVPPFVAGFATQATGTGDPAFQVLPCFLSNAAVPFAAYAGSVRHTFQFTVKPFDSSVESNSALVWLSRRPAYNDNNEQAWTYTGTDFNTQTLAFMGVGNGADVAVRQVTDGYNWSVEVPYVAHRYASPVVLEATTSSDASVRVGFVGSSTSNPQDIAFIDYVSAGDDFDLFEWVGVPAMTYTLAPTTLWVDQ